MFDIWPVMNKCTVVAKKELFWAWPFGLAAWLCGLIFIDRMRAEKAKSAINTAIDYIKEKKIKLWIFPEGTRRNTKELHPFKKGAFHVAIASELPILPVVFSSYQTFLDDKNKILENGHIIITALPPIETKGLYSPDQISELMEHTRNLMTATFLATTKEVEELNDDKFAQLNKSSRKRNLSTPDKMINNNFKIYPTRHGFIEHESLPAVTADMH